MELATRRRFPNAAIPISVLRRLVSKLRRMSPVISFSANLIELLRSSELEEAELTNKLVKSGFVKAFAL